MIANKGIIKRIMYMGNEISEAKYNDEVVWVKTPVIKPPPPKPCTTNHQSGSGCSTCERAVQCNTCESGQSCGQGCTVCLKNQSTETA